MVGRGEKGGGQVRVTAEEKRREEKRREEKRRAEKRREEKRREEKRRGGGLSSRKGVGRVGSLVRPSLPNALRGLWYCDGIRVISPVCHHCFAIVSTATVTGPASPRVASPCALHPKWSIRWLDLGDLTYIAEGGFGKVFSASWRGREVSAAPCGPSSGLRAADSEDHRVCQWAAPTATPMHDACSAWAMRVVVDQAAVKEARPRRRGQPVPGSAVSDDGRLQVATLEVGPLVQSVNPQYA